MTSDITTVTTELLQEIAVITNAPIASLNPEKSLAANGIHSLGFVELLLTVRRRWDVDLTVSGVSMAEVKSICALAEHICQLRKKA